MSAPAVFLPDAVPSVGTDPAALDAAILSALADGEPGEWTPYRALCQRIRADLAWEKARSRSEMDARHKVISESLARLGEARRIEGRDAPATPGNDVGYEFRQLPAPLVLHEDVSLAPEDDLTDLSDPFAEETPEEAELRARFEAEEREQKRREEQEARDYARGRASLAGPVGEKALERIIARIEHISQRPVPRSSRGAIAEGVRRARAAVLDHLPEDERTRLRGLAYAELKRNGKGRGNLAVDLLAARIHNREQQEQQQPRQAAEGADEGEKRAA